MSILNKIISISIVILTITLNVSIADDVPISNHDGPTLHQADVGYGRETEDGFPLRRAGGDIMMHSADYVNHFIGEFNDFQENYKTYFPEEMSVTVPMINWQQKIFDNLSEVMQYVRAIDKNTNNNTYNNFWRSTLPNKTLKNTLTDESSVYYGSRISFIRRGNLVTCFIKINLNNRKLNPLESYLKCDNEYILLKDYNVVPNENGTSFNIVQNYKLNHASVMGNSIADIPIRRRDPSDFMEKFYKTIITDSTDSDTIYGRLYKTSASNPRTLPVGTTGDTVSSYTGYQLLKYCCWHFKSDVVSEGGHEYKVFYRFPAYPTKYLMFFPRLYTYVKGNTENDASNDFIKNYYDQLLTFAEIPFGYRPIESTSIPVTLTFIPLNESVFNYYQSRRTIREIIFSNLIDTESTVTDFTYGSWYRWLESGLWGASSFGRFIPNDNTPTHIATETYNVPAKRFSDYLTILGRNEFNEAVKPNFRIYDSHARNSSVLDPMPAEEYLNYQTHKSQELTINVSKNDFWESKRYKVNDEIITEKSGRIFGLNNTLRDEMFPAKNLNMNKDEYAGTYDNKTISNILNTEIFNRIVSIEGTASWVTSDPGVFEIVNE